jgi:hypothetical protein
MQLNNLLQIDFGILLSSISCMYRKEVCYFGESINDYPNGIMLLRYLGKPTMKSMLMSSHFQDGIGSG